MNTSEQPPFDSKTFLARVAGTPGVYRMLDGKGKVLYIGKARNLKKRLASYFRPTAQLSPKTRALVRQIADIEIIATHTETEALILENNLIKSHQPRYNILLRDDKGYPYIYLSADEFPRLTGHRGAKAKNGRYFGPYPGMGSVRETLNLLQKLFPVRQCDNSFFKNRSRPCLQHQIKRCTGPCVDLIDKDSYAEDVEHTILFLEGKNNLVTETLEKKMHAAAARLDYENAARYRDQIARLRRLQERQYMEADNQDDIDIAAAVCEADHACVQILSIRGGRSLGGRAFYPKQVQDNDAAAVLAAFLPQYYLARTRDIPREIILSHKLEDLQPLREALSQQRGGSVKIHTTARGTRAHWLETARDNAALALSRHKPTQHRERLTALALALDLETLPERLECFDISHTQGEAAGASCVVFDQDGPRSSDYRRYNIRGIQGGDDYAAMRQVLQRRFAPYAETRDDKTTEQTQAKTTPPPLPDILLIDGGKGQLKQAEDVLNELNIKGIILLGIVKGMGRKAEFDRILLPDGAQALILPANSPALHLLQQLRDEAHRFAITGHRQRRAKARRVSTLEEIDGIGAQRRRRLISHFGGLQGVTRAGVEDLAQVSGISRQLAQKIYDNFHDKP